VLRDGTEKVFSQTLTTCRELGAFAASALREEQKVPVMSSVFAGSRRLPVRSNA
jgi:hypothetical protein